MYGKKKAPSIQLEGPAARVAPLRRALHRLLLPK